MQGLRLVLLSVVLAGCTSAAASPSVAPTTTATPTATAAPSPSVAVTATAAAPSVPATPAPSVSGSPRASTACLDPNQFGDTAPPIGDALQGIDAALKVPDLVSARQLATNAVMNLRTFAVFASSAQPAAAKLIRSAAADLDKAKAQFPGGLALLAQAEAEWSQGILLAERAGCPA